MSSLLKSAVLSLGVLAGTAAVALAQSVSSLPPSGPATAAAVATPPSSTSKIFPNPGGNTTWQEEHAQPAVGAEADRSQHPYSPSIGPQPGSHSSGKDEHYDATDGDKAPSRHPYTSNLGPKTN
jgi:hypothetical protein